MLRGKARADRKLVYVSTESDYLDVPEFADLIHGTPAVVYGLNYTGEAPPRYRAGKKLLYKRTEVMAWLESRRVEPAPKAS
jgi:hypothetical protein